MVEQQQDLHVSSELQWICRTVLQSFAAFRGAEIDASFYPYIGMTHTIRRKGSTWVIRVSDHCRHAPRRVLAAVVFMLACKVTRRKPPARMVDEYEYFRRDPAIDGAVRHRRLVRGRKVIGSPAGRHHALEEIYQDLNRRYFNGQIEVKQLGWGPRRGWSRLGHYDPLHHTITISPVLDSARVPRTVVAFVVFHEMLHAVFDELPPNAGRRRYHHAAFRQAERGYCDYDSARNFLREFCRRSSRKDL